MTNLFLIVYVLLLAHSLTPEINPYTKANMLDTPMLLRNPVNMYNISVISDQSMSLHKRASKPEYDEFWLYII